MKRVLVVKTSSLGDVIHTLPALTDAARAIPDIRFDWVVEESFSEIPRWHAAVDRVIPVALRRWRKQPIQARRSGEWAAFKQQLGEVEYHAIIDAQGLLKSAWLTRYARGVRYGLNKSSAREPLATKFYHHCLNVPKGQHAVERVRQLFSQALQYSIEQQSGDYGLTFGGERQNTVVLLHGTTWQTKHWPEAEWNRLAVLLVEAGYRPLLPWGNAAEQARAKRIAAQSKAEVLPKMNLTELAGVLASSAGCVSVDTGLGHLAAAVNTPTVSLFGPTNPSLTGFYGKNQLQLHSTFHCAPCMRRECKYKLEGNASPPCFDELPADRVFSALTEMLGQNPASETGGGR